MIPDFTILCAVDSSHIEELRLSYETWKRHKPSLLRRPMLVICDPYTSPAQNYDEWYWDQLSFLRDHPGLARLKFPLWLQEATVRERMVSAFVYGVKWIYTPYYLKLDSDLVATGKDDWIDPSWFENSPAIIAPKWGYSKPAAMLNDLDRWAEGNFLSSGREVHRTINGERAHHSRFISYCQFGNADWTWEAAELAGERLPCPSQDTFLSYCAVRSGAKIQFADMKARGWRHVGSNISRLRKAAAEAMEMPIT